MDSNETIDLDLNAVTATLNITKPAAFAQVTFRGIGETYPVGSDVECIYTVGASLEATGRDWVGLYKVGWRSSADYIYYEWSPLPVNYTSGAVFENRIVFPAGRLPKDDGEFYQFCYVAGTGLVRGASAPFQFKRPSVDDLIEIEDENGELLVIRTKTAVLEEQLKKANETRQSLKQDLQILENERDLLKFREAEISRKLSRCSDERDTLRMAVQDRDDQIADMKHEATDLLTTIKALQDKLDQLNQERSEMEKTLSDNETHIVHLQEQIKVLVNEKDELAGRAKYLLEEKELFKAHLTSSESTLQNYLAEYERLKCRVTEEEANSVRWKKETERLEKELETERRRMEEQVAMTQADREQIGDLGERLRNAEDKLSAAEHCKMMLNDEVLALKQVFEKTSANLEVSTADNDVMRRQLSQLESNLRSERQQSAQWKEDLISQKTEEQTALREQIGVLERQLTELRTQKRSEDDGPLYALQMAQNTLTQRYTKMTKKNEELQKALEEALQTKHEWNQTEADLQQEVKCLGNRLAMGQEAYRVLYIQSEERQAEITKLRKKRGRRTGAREDSPMQQSARTNNDDVTSVTSQQSRKTGTDAATLAPLYPGGLDNAEVQQQLKTLATELDRRRNELKQSKQELCQCRQMYYEEHNRHMETERRLEAAYRELEALKPSRRQFRPAPATPEPSQDNTAPKLEPLCMPPPQLRKADSVRSFDPLGSDDTQRTLEAPLKPLPPPMLPERLPSAKVASVKAAIGGGVLAAGINSMNQFCPDVDDDIAVGGTDAAAIADEDKFVDAPGEPQRVCPTCHIVLPVEMTELELDEHFTAHYGAVCPMCYKQFDEGMPQSTIEQHVNAHFNNPE